MTDDSFDPARGDPIAEDEFDDAVEALEGSVEGVYYEPLADYFGSGGGQDARPTEPAESTVSAAGQGEGIFTHETLTDSVSGAAAANVLVPAGWDVSLDVNWGFVSTSSPGVGTVTLTSPDGRAEISMVSNQAFADISVGDMRVAEGIDQGLYTTNLFYRDAAAFVEDSLTASFGEVELVETLPVSEEMEDMIREAAEVKLKSMAGTASTLVDSEGTVQHALYRSGDTYFECLVFVTGAQVHLEAGAVSMDEISWNVPVSFMLTADSREAWEEYTDEFAVVAANSAFTEEFLYMNISYGAAINDMISQGLMEQSESYIQSNAGSWLDDYESSSTYDSSDWANQWSDVIYERNEYETLDGGTIKVDTAYDSVYQDGDSIYMGPAALAPEGWTELEQTY